MSNRFFSVARHQRADRRSLKSPLALLAAVLAVGILSPAAIAQTPANCQGPQAVNDPTCAGYTPKGQQVQNQVAPANQVGPANQQNRPTGTPRSNVAAQTSPSGRARAGRNARATSRPSSTHGRLPFTGLDVSIPILLGTLLLVAGITLRLVVRGPRRSASGAQHS